MTVEVPQLLLACFWKVDKWEAIKLECLHIAHSLRAESAAARDSREHSLRLLSIVAALRRSTVTDMSRQFQPICKTDVQRLLLLIIMKDVAWLWTQKEILIRAIHHAHRVLKVYRCTRR